MQIIENAVLEKVDQSGYKFTYDNYTDYLTIEDVIRPDKAKLELAIENLIKNNPYLVKLNDVKIFIFPYRLRGYNDGWTESHYVAKAYDNHIIIGGVSMDESLESYLAHELFHIFQKRFISDLSDYKRLRNIPSSWEYDTGYYYHRVAEIICEDLRYFFATPECQKDVIGLYSEIEKPNTIIKNYLLSKIPVCEEIKLQIGNKLMLANNIPIEMDVAPFIKENRTYIPLRFVSEQLGLFVLWNDKDKTIKLLK